MTKYTLTGRSSSGAQVLLLALGALSFADKNTKSGGAVADKEKAGSTTAAVTDAAAEQAEKPKRPELSIKSLADLDALPPEQREQVLQGAKTRASVQAGTVGVYLKEDGTETTNKDEAKRAQGGRGRVIAKYTPPRPPDQVAVEELTRMLRLGWSRAAREAVTKRMAGRKNPLSEDELVKILKENGAPMSYLRPKASKRLYGRVLTFIQAGPLPSTEAGQQSQVQEMAKAS